MSFARHAAPPPGEWFNDPNGLILRGGQWHLFVQHSAAAPDFKQIGWGLLTSPDLLTWTWKGQVIEPDHLGQAYSGSIVTEGEELAAYLTRHDGSVQRQVRLASADGCCWTQSAPLGPEGRNVRDPFVFFCRTTGDWRMLVAEPCDWTGWAENPPSRLSVWRLAEGAWIYVSHIGPWMPAGIMWEVPVLVDFDERQALIMSLVDRREDRIRCSVVGWIGRFDGAVFHCEHEAGQLLDMGPDFYAAIVKTGGKGDPLLVAWASSWATARRMPWPGGVHGGPITLPRELKLDRGSTRLKQKLAVDLPPARIFSFDGTAPADITIEGDGCRLEISIDSTGVMISRSGSDLLEWHHRETVTLRDRQTITLHEDQGLIEVFIHPEGLAATVFLPGARL